MPATRRIAPGAPPPGPFPNARNVRSPLASSVPAPLSLEAFRVLAAQPGAVFPPGMLTAMRAMFHAQGNGQSARELETLFDFATGRSRPG